ncbi:Fibrinogen- domains (FReDs) [Branchiostoma belcheri]|nr:Fibrinogen- domains (FReDs) [Branchiostoma belcheri]
MSKEDATLEQQNQTYLMSVADAAANIPNAMYASGADATLEQRDQTERRPLADATANIPNATNGSGSDATLEQQDQIDWRSLADAAANIPNAMYASGADATLEQRDQTERRPLADAAANIPNATNGSGADAKPEQQDQTERRPLADAAATTCMPNPMYVSGAETNDTITCNVNKTKWSRWCKKFSWNFYAKPEQQYQNDWRSLADAAANIPNAMYASIPETDDTTTCNVDKTKWSRWCKKFWWAFGGLVFAVMAVALPFVAEVNDLLAGATLPAYPNVVPPEVTSDANRDAGNKNRFETISRSGNLQILSQEVTKLSVRQTELEHFGRLSGPPGPLGPPSPPGPPGPSGPPGQCSCPTPAAPDCAAYKAAGHTTSGVYTLGSPLSGVEVYCDMDTAGGGWTIIQRRMDGSVPFNRTWEEYKHGFGNKNGEYWLGNDNIHLLTTQKNYTLRVELMDWENQTRYAEYDTFRVAGESDQYRLTVSGYSGTAGDSMKYNNGQKFSTVDRDNDATSSRHCSQWRGQGGWWYRGCGNAYINGRYLRNCGNSCPTSEGVVWGGWRFYCYSLKSVSMKIRPR